MLLVSNCILLVVRAPLNIQHLPQASRLQCMHSSFLLIPPHSSPTLQLRGEDVLKAGAINTARWPSSSLIHSQRRRKCSVGRKEVVRAPPYGSLVLPSIAHAVIYGEGKQSMWPHRCCPLIQIWSAKSGNAMRLSD